MILYLNYINYKQDRKFKNCHPKHVMLHAGCLGCNTLRTKTHQVQSIFFFQIVNHFNYWQPCLISTDVCRY